MTSPYIPLHLHTAKGSIGDSILKIPDLMKKAKEMELPYLATTNHGSMNDIFDFYSQAVKAGIQPIIGCEVYETGDRLSKEKKAKGESLDEEGMYRHLVLLAKNQEGFKNLLAIVSNAQLEGFYYKPRTDFAYMKDRGKGIIALSACLGGKIPKILSRITPDSTQEEAQLVYDAAAAEVARYKEIFDEFYLELQPGSFQEQIWANLLLVELAEYTDTPLVITNDVHYLDKEDWKAHDVHVKIARKMNVDDPPTYPDTCYYLMDRSTVESSFAYLDPRLVKKAIDNTLAIAKKCTLELAFDHLHMPKYETPGGDTEETLLAKISFARLNEIYNVVEDPAEYTSRLIYELEVIAELGFAGYFLTVMDFVKYAKSADIPVGPGRGSVCGSLVSYLCGMTAVDPIKYGLLFERFLSVHRKGSIPDVDMDFSADKRHLMFEYAVQKYGLENCAKVSTFSIRKAKASIRDTARVFVIDPELADEAAKLIPEVYYDDEGDKTTDLSIEDSLNIVPRLREIAEENPDWFDMAIKLEDLPKNTSIHAAGTLVSPVNLTEFIPLVRPNAEDGLNATALNLGDAETAGFVKYDFLSLATLWVIDRTEKDVGFRFNFTEDDYNDPDTWELISSKHTTGLFQIASRTYKDRMHRLRPSSIEELAACLALVRGPCISSKMDQQYMEIVEGKREVDLIHPLYDSITAETKGALLYQEQLMKIAVNFGFTLEDSYRLMKAVAKKKISVIASFEEDFRNMAKARNVPDAATDRIWQIMLDAGLYSFNKSHAVAYALLCYQSAYLKAHYPGQYMANALTNAYVRKEETVETAQECRRLGIRFRPLDVNVSNWEFTLEEDGSIRVGMCAIKSFGEKAAAEVIEHRPFSSLEDFLERITKKNCTKTALVPAIFAGLFSPFQQDRVTVYKEFCELRKEEVKPKITLQSKQSFEMEDTYDIIETVLLDIPLITSPVNAFTPIGYGDVRNGKTVEMRAVIRKIKKIKDRSGKNMAFLTLETADGYIDGTLFSSTYETYKKLCKKDSICTVRIKKDKDDSGIVQKIA